MKSISNNKNSTILLLTSLAMALLFLLYYYVVQPKQDEAQHLRADVSALQSEIDDLTKQLDEHETTQAKLQFDEVVLRKKVPATREIDALILSLEQIEYVTGSRINTVDFNNYDDLVVTAGLTDPTKASLEQQASTDETNEQPPTTTILAETLPTSLKLVTFSVNVTSPSEEKLIEFIKELEQIERVMHVDAIDFAFAGEEEKLTLEHAEIVSADVQVTTFYYE